jgi:hypothetical protein
MAEIKEKVVAPAMVPPIPEWCHALPESEKKAL